MKTRTGIIPALCRKWQRLLLGAALMLCPYLVSAQYTSGVTGLLHAPSAEMQEDKTVMIGGNFLHRELTPPTWYYHTYNYYLNVTIMPWIEVGYVCTLFSAEGLGLDEYGYSGFTNQDRHFTFRIRALKEGQFWKHMPAVVFGTSDPYTSSGGGTAEVVSGNGYFNRYYVAATKHFRLGTEEIGVHLSYVFNLRKDYPLNGVACGITYNPSFHPQLRLIAEYDSRDVAVGATYTLFDHLHFVFELQRFKYFSGGVMFRFNLH